MSKAKPYFWVVEWRTQNLVTWSPIRVASTKQLARVMLKQEVAKQRGCLYRVSKALRVEE